MSLKQSILATCSGIALLTITGAAGATGAVSTIDGFPGSLPTNIGVGLVGLTDDGAMALGNVRLDAYNYRVYKFSSDGKALLQGPAGDVAVYAKGISGDGQVAVGYSQKATGIGYRALMWNGSTLTTLTNLNTGTESYTNILSSQANAISANGKVAVGASYSSGGYKAVRWVDAGSPESIHGGGYIMSFATAVDGVGATVAGYGSTTSYNAAGQRVGGYIDEAFRWTAASGMTRLGVLAAHEGELARSQATGISRDGSVVVGLSRSGGDVMEAFRWTAATGMAGLGTFSSGTYSRADAVSSDGSVVVGSGDRMAPGALVKGVSAFRWTAASGMQYIGDWLAANGVTVGDNTFTDAKAVNAAGNIIAGTGQINGTTQQYIARVNNTTTTTTTTTTTPAPTTAPTTTPITTPAPAPQPISASFGSGVIGVNDFVRSLSGLSGPLNVGVEMAGLGLWGAHHRPLVDYGAGNNCFWATGDFSRNGQADRNRYLSEIGACADIGQFRVGAGVGYSGQRQDLAWGGDSRLNGYHLMAEADYRVPGTGLVASVTGSWGRWNAKLNRNYLNGAAVDTSRADTDTQSAALRGRLDWRKAAEISGVALSPFVSYTQVWSRTDGYTESGGGFPVSVNATDSTAREFRFGASASTALGESVSLGLTGEWVHRFDGSTSAVSGEILGGLGGFSVPGASIDRNWFRAGADVDVKVSANSLVTFSLQGEAGHSSGNAATGSVGYRLSF